MTTPSIERGGESASSFESGSSNVYVNKDSSQSYVPDSTLAEGSR
jgi:hypothetical protein